VPSVRMLTGAKSPWVRTTGRPANRPGTASSTRPALTGSCSAQRELAHLRRRDSCPDGRPRQSLHDPQPVPCVLPVAVALHDGPLAAGERNHVGAVGETPRGPGSGRHRAAERAFDQLSLRVLRLHKPEATGDHCRPAATAAVRETPPPGAVPGPAVKSGHGETAHTSHRVIITCPGPGPQSRPGMPCPQVPWRSAGARD
jgi:hypothetical protein